MKARVADRVVKNGRDARANGRIHPAPCPEFGLAHPQKTGHQRKIMQSTRQKFERSRAKGDQHAKVMPWRPVAVTKKPAGMLIE